MLRILGAILVFNVCLLVAAPLERTLGDFDLAKIVLVDIQTDHTGKVSANITLHGETKTYDAAISSAENASETQKAVNTPVGIFRVHGSGVSYVNSGNLEVVPSYKKEWLFYDESNKGAVFSLRAAQKGEVLGGKTTRAVTLLPADIFSQISESYHKGTPIIVRINEQQQD